MTARERAEVTFTSAVNAEEIHFQKVPESRIGFTGDTDHRSTSGSLRTHLPDAVRPGITYRDARVDYWIVARLRADLMRPEH